MNPFSRSIRMLFICSVVVLSTLLLGLLAYINARQLSENMETELKAMLTARSGEISEKFDKRLTQVSGKTASLALNISSMQSYDMMLVARYITAIVKSDDAIFGSGLWFAPNEYPERKRLATLWSQSSGAAGARMSEAAMIRKLDPSVKRAAQNMLQSASTKSAKVISGSVAAGSGRPASQVPKITAFSR